MADEKKPEVVTEEIAQISKGRDITRGYVEPMGLLQNTDSVLATRGGGDLKIYDEILRDDQVKATFSQRRAAVTSSPWEVVAGGDSPLDEEAADFARQTLKRINFDRVTDKMLFGVFYGYSVAECIWAPNGNRVDLAAVKVKNRRRFRFTASGALCLLTSSAPLGEVMPERKFWVFSTGADDDDEPYGRGLGHWLYWPVFFKRNDLKFWLMFIEKHGIPTVAGKHPATATKAEKDKLLEAATAVQSDAAVVFADTMDLALIESARSGSVDQATLYDKMNEAVSKVVLSQTMTTDDGASLAQGTVHMGVRQEVVRSDADLVCESFSNGPLKWLIEYNFPGAKLPQVWRQMPRSAEQAAQAELMVKVVSTGVARPTLQSIQDTFDGEWEAAPAPAPASPFGGQGGGFNPSFAEVVRKLRPRLAPIRQHARWCSPVSFAETADDVAQLADQIDDLASDPLDSVLDAVKRAITGARSYDDMRARLNDLIATSNVDPALIASIYQGAFENAQLTGAADVVDEIKTGSEA